jgi:DNA processing protein
LFVQGDVAALEPGRSVAVVGTRHPTEGGRLMSARIAGTLARHGVVVDSGLAIGIDGAAHAAAVAGDSPTVAVIAGGHARIYPAAHERLADEIVATGGAIVSEMAPGTPSLAAYFIRRNRLIAGLADATVVVEAPVRSGALSTARWALEQGRECFVVPGPIDEPRSAGCLALLRAYAPMARVVAGVGELLEDLELLLGDGPPRRRRRRESQAALVLAELGPTEAAVARQLLAGRTTVDGIAGGTRLPVATVLGALTMLELRGYVTGIYGRYRASGRLAAAEPPP